MIVQYIITGLIVVAALGYVARSIYKSAKGSACESGNCKCSPASREEVIS